MSKNAHVVIRQEGFEDDVIIAVFTDYRKADKEIKKLNADIHAMDDERYYRKAVPLK